MKIKKVYPKIQQEDGLDLMIIKIIKAREVKGNQNLLINKIIVILLQNIKKQKKELMILILI